MSKQGYVCDTYMERKVWRRRWWPKYRHYGLDRGQFITPDPNFGTFLFVTEETSAITSRLLGERKDWSRIRRNNRWEKLP